MFYPFRKTSNICWADMLKEKNSAAIADWFFERFAGIGFWGVFFAAIAAWLDKDFSTCIRVFGFGLLFAAASAVAGWLLGLLFGVPRALTHGQPGIDKPATGAEGRRSSSRVNTNLEDISDWLTKTIVGVGLTQLYAVPHYAWSTAHKLNMAGFGWNPHGQLLVLAAFVYFASGGFWMGYVGTRTVLTRLLESIDGVSADTVDKATGTGGMKLSLSGQSIEPAQDEALRAADHAILALPRQSLQSPQEVAAWGAAQARAGNVIAARIALEEAHSADPSNVDIRRLLAKVYIVLNMRHEAERLTEGLPDTEIDVFNALYDEAPSGYEKAIRIGERLAAREGSERSARLHMWLACAYGQKHGHLRDSGAPAEEVAKARARALEEAAIAIQIEPDTRDVLYGAWKPERGAEDTDLTSFAEDDPDLMKLLESGTVQGMDPASNPSAAAPASGTTNVTSMEPPAAGSGDETTKQKVEPEKK